MKSIQVKAPGGPEKMELAEVPKPTPGPKQALVRIAASGVNFIDVYFRTGLYKADLPITLGSEGAGTVEAVGADAGEVAAGDFTGNSPGTAIPCWGSFARKSPS